MEKRPIDFEGYLDILSRELKVDDSCRDSICREVKQNLDDKYGELLIRGHGLEAGITETIENFEDPHKLADMFNELYGRNSHDGFAVRDKALLVILSATLIISLLA